MVLWANTADGWGSDASKSGNGALGTYLQSSLASAPKSPSEKQAGDPTNTMPTSSISRMAQPAVSRSTLTQPTITTAAPATATVVQAPSAPTNSLVTALAPSRMALATPATTTAVAADPNTVDAQAEADAKYAALIKAKPELAILPRATLEQMQRDTAMPFKGIWDVAPPKPGQTVEQAWNEYTAAKRAEYQQTLVAQGSLPEFVSTGSAAADNGLRKIRDEVLAEYTENQASAAVFKRGVDPVDTSQQDAINQSSIAALASRYSTNISKGDIGAVSRVYASALSAQTGINSQMSDEAYATGFNRNLANFTQAVQNNATLDANSTGLKMQTQITAMGDVIANLQQQVSQLGTAAASKVNDQLISLQQQINDYTAAAREYGSESDTIVKWGKGILGAIVGITAIALAPVTSGASIAGGVALGAAVAKA